MPEPIARHAQRRRVRTRPAPAALPIRPEPDSYAPPCEHILPRHAPVAQLDRAPDYESGGRRFESFRARHVNLLILLDILAVIQGQPSVPIYGGDALGTQTVLMPCFETIAGPAGLSDRLRFRLGPDRRAQERERAAAQAAEATKAARRAPARHPAGFIDPCLPTLGRAVPSGPQWVHEIKHDG